ncbi:hypothetical protein [Legionella fairfieldensis]|uniref:hypothetical protein n=1 Tax=Legionella fairfieldensis TaxID=45064 RepID=UPI00068918E7|nr:hypothetical protein [Legionella fairfieldensis]
MLWPIYLIIGFWQFFAIVDGLEIWYGLHGVIATILAFFIAQVPIIGTLVGMYGAVDAWNWSWLSAFLLYFGPFILIIMLSLIGNVATKAHAIFKR